MAEADDRRMDRFVEGKLSPEEARELARASLDNPELFEDLMDHAVAKAGLTPTDADPFDSFIRGIASPAAGRQLAKAALDEEELFDALVAHGAVECSLEDPEFRAALSQPVETNAKVVRFPHRKRAIAIGSIAAAVAVIGIYAWRSIPQSLPAPSATAKVEAPSLDPAAGRAILLAADLRPEASTSAPVFRSAETEGRGPQPTGAILSVEDRQATVSLGSLDGLAKGTELQVFRGESKQPITSMQVTTVFRDRARGRVARGQSVQANDRVEARPAVYLDAILEQMNRVGDPDKAREMARSAFKWADSVAAPPAARRKMFERLGSLDYQAGDALAAESDYRSAIASFSEQPNESPVDQAATLNSLAVLYLLRGDYPEAASQLDAARAKASSGTMYARTLNNLAVLAELRGDQSKAIALYKDARSALGNTPEAFPGDRRAVEANLARLERGDDGNR